MASIQESLNDLFDAERKARSLHLDVLGHPRPELVGVLGEATREALALTDEHEASLRLARLAVLLGDLEGDEAVDLLVDILGAEAPEARVVAGEALEALAFDRFKEVALGIERALERLPKGSPALTELPFLLAEVGEPGCVKLLGRFLKHPDPEACAAAIEALVELGDPAAASMLTALERDPRQVQLEDDSGEGERIAIGDLAHEARELLEEMAREANEHANRAPKAAGSTTKKGKGGGR